MYHDNIHSRQEDMENIASSLNRYLEEGRHVLTLNDFAALSQSNIILQKLKKLEVENTEYHQQAPLIDTVPFSISSQTHIEMISTLGIVGGPPREFRFLFNRFVSKLIFLHSRTTVCPTKVQNK